MKFPKLADQAAVKNDLIVVTISSDNLIAMFNEDMTAAGSQTSKTLTESVKTWAKVKAKTLDWPSVAFVGSTLIMTSEKPTVPASATTDARSTSTPDGRSKLNVDVRGRQPDLSRM